MFVDFDKYTNPILAVSVSEDNQFIDLDTTTYIIKLKANAKRPSSIFKSYNADFSELVGKVILKISEIDFPEDYTYDSDNEYDDCVIKAHMYEIEFKNNDEPFQMLLINYSNGSYDGWLSAKVVYKSSRDLLTPLDI